MDEDRGPKGLAVVIGKGKENSIADTDKNLVDQANEAGVVGGVEKEVEGKVPDSPGQAQEEGPLDHAKVFLEKRLEVEPPAIFFPEKENKAKGKVYQQKKDVDDFIGGQVG